MTTNTNEGLITALRKGGKAADSVSTKPAVIKPSGPSGEEVLGTARGQAAAARRAEQQSAAAAELKGSAAPPTSPPSAIKQGIDDVEAVLPKGRPEPSVGDLSKINVPSKAEPSLTKPRLTRQPGESAAEYTARVEQHLKDLESQTAQLSRKTPTFGDQLPVPSQGRSLPPTSTDLKALDRALFGHAAAAGGLYAADKLSRTKSSAPDVPDTIKPLPTPQEPERFYPQLPKKTDYSLIPDTNESILESELNYLKSVMQRLKI